MKFGNCGIHSDKILSIRQEKPICYSSWEKWFKKIVFKFSNVMSLFFFDRVNIVSRIIVLFVELKDG